MIQNRLTVLAHHLWLSGNMMRNLIEVGPDICTVSLLIPYFLYNFVTERILGL
jgi:hypothetical protein